MSEARVVIRHEREKPVVNQHPWVFSGAIAHIDGAPQPGEIVTLVTERGRFLGRGYYNPKSQIVVRILTWHDEPVDLDWWRAGIARAADARRLTIITQQDEMANPVGFRLVNAENDYLPGLVVDVYDQYAVLQALTLGVEQRKHAIAALLPDFLRLKGVYERSDVDVRGKEGLKPATGVLWGDAPPDHIRIMEGCCGLPILQVDVRVGHKTGFYLDQRPNRELLQDLVTDYVEDDFRVLNLFAYTGGFGLHALTNYDVTTVNVDSSYEALQLAESNAQVNDPEWLDRAEFIQADVFDYLRDQRDAGELYDLIVCDPPKFAQNAQQVEGAARGYKDLNLNAFKLVREGGWLMTFSCSGAVTADLFQKIVFGALADSGRQAQIVRHLGAGDDHPVALTFPEGAYLKGLLLRVY